MCMTVSAADSRAAWANDPDAWVAHNGREVESCGELATLLRMPIDRLNADCVGDPSMTVEAQDCLCGVDVERIVYLAGWDVIESIYDYKIIPRRPLPALQEDTQQ